MSSIRRSCRSSVGDSQLHSDSRSLAGVSAETFNAGELGRGGLDDIVIERRLGLGRQQFPDERRGDQRPAGEWTFQRRRCRAQSRQRSGIQSANQPIRCLVWPECRTNGDILTKGGTNNWHGTVWEFLRNEALNANDYFRNETGQPRAELRQNQFGFTAGGPIKKDKLLFFTSYQGTRQRNGIASTCSSSVILPVLTSDRSAAGLAQAVGAGTAFGGMDPLGRAGDRRQRQFSGARALQCQTAQWALRDSQSADRHHRHRHGPAGGVFHL